MKKPKPISYEEDIRPPIGLIPKRFHREQVGKGRLKDIRGAITRYLNQGLKIDIDWVEEYNQLIDNNKLKPRKHGR